MATDAEIEATRQQWRDISYQALPEEEKDAMRMCMAVEIGKAIIKGEAKTKAQFVECFHELLGSTAEQYARTAYTIGMTSTGNFEEMDLWEDEEEAEQRVLEATFATAKDEIVREGFSTAQTASVPKAVNSRQRTMFNSTMIWAAILGLVIFASIGEIAKTSRHKGTVRIEPEYGGSTWVQSESQFKLGEYMGAALILSIALFLWYIIAKDSENSKR